MIGVLLKKKKKIIIIIIIITKSIPGGYRILLCGHVGNSL